MANPSQIAASACVASARRPREMAAIAWQNNGGDITGVNDENDVHAMYTGMELCACANVVSFCHGRVKDSDPFQSLLRVYLKNPKNHTLQIQECSGNAIAEDFGHHVLSLFSSALEPTRLRDDGGPFRNAELSRWWGRGGQGCIYDGHGDERRSPGVGAKDAGNLLN